MAKLNIFKRLWKYMREPDFKKNRDINAADVRKILKSDERVASSTEDQVPKNVIAEQEQNNSHPFIDRTEGGSQLQTDISENDAERNKVQKDQEDIQRLELQLKNLEKEMDNLEDDHRSARNLKEQKLIERDMNQLQTDIQNTYMELERAQKLWRDKKKSQIQKINLEDFDSGEIVILPDGRHVEIIGVQGKYFLVRYKSETFTVDVHGYEKSQKVSKALGDFLSKVNLSEDTVSQLISENDESARESIASDATKAANNNDMNEEFTDRAEVWARDNMDKFKHDKSALINAVKTKFSITSANARLIVEGTIDYYLVDPKEQKLWKDMTTGTETTATEMGDNTDLDKDFGIGGAGPIPQSLLAEQDLEGGNTSTTKEDVSGPNPNRVSLSRKKTSKAIDDFFGKLGIAPYGQSQKDTSDTPTFDEIKEVAEGHGGTIQNEQDLTGDASDKEKAEKETRFALMSRRGRYLNGFHSNGGWEISDVFPTSSSSYIVFSSKQEAEEYISRMRSECERQRSRWKEWTDVALDFVEGLKAVQLSSKSQVSKMISDFLEKAQPDMKFIDDHGSFKMYGYNDEVFKAVCTFAPNTFFGGNDYDAVEKEAAMKCPQKKEVAKFRKDFVIRGKGSNGSTRTIGPFFTLEDAQKEKKALEKKKEQDWQGNEVKWTYTLDGQETGTKKSMGSQLADRMAEQGEDVQTIAEELHEQFDYDWAVADTMAAEAVDKAKGRKDTKL